MSRWLRTALLIWVPLAVVVTGGAGMVYEVAQQVERQGANDSLVALAEEAGRRLNAGAAATAVIPETRVEAAESLDPLVMVFDEQGHQLASSGTLAGGPLDYPQGVLSAARHGGEQAPTWQPRPGLRFASVALHHPKGFVVAARSLRLVESRIDELGQFVLAMWLATIAAMTIATAATAWVADRAGSKI